VIPEGADANAEDKHGSSPLGKAIEYYGDKELAELLRGHGGIQQNRPGELSPTGGETMPIATACNGWEDRNYGFQEHEGDPGGTCSFRFRSEQFGEVSSRRAKR